MNIYIYSDESGVFDKVHNDLFVFGGLIIPETASKEAWIRKYLHAERVLRKNKKVSDDYELKATQISNKEKGKLFRSLDMCHKFGVVIKEQNVLDRIFQSKKDKQRYLDYAYKIAVKRAFEDFIRNGIINPSTVERLYFYADEHTTATNGRYELGEALEQEFKVGTYNYTYDKYYPPIFPQMQSVTFEYCNSQTTLLVRAADIVANKIFFLARNNKYKEIATLNNTHVIYLP